MSILTKPSKSNTKSFLRRLSAGTPGLGIDIGQINTKIVIAKRDSTGTLQYQGVTVPTTQSGTPANDPSTPTQESASSAERRRGHTLIGCAANSNRLSLSTRAIKQLMLRVSHVIATNTDAQDAHVGVTLSMAACDYRTLYAPKNSRVNTAGIQKSIAAATGDNRSRCVTVIPGHDSQADARQTKIRCFSLPEELAWTLAHYLDGIGLMPDALNGLPWCIANALEMALPPEESAKINIGIDWSYGQPMLVSVRQGEIDYVRCLSSGSLRDLAAPATDQFKIAPAEAGRWLAHCMQGPTQLEVDAVATETRDWARETCTRLAAEIGTAVDFIRWRNQGVELETIWLLGGVTEIPGMTELLQSMVPCELKPWRVDAGNNTLSAEYAMAASLAWMGLRHA